MELTKAEELAILRWFDLIDRDKWLQSHDLKLAIRLYQSAGEPLPAWLRKVALPSIPGQHSDYGKYVLNDDGSIKNFTLKIDGKPWRCRCLANVLSKPDDTDPDFYMCNGCGLTLEATE